MEQVGWTRFMRKPVGTGPYFVDGEIKDYKNVQLLGAEVVGVKKGSPAEQARFLEGDVIISVNGIAINGADDCVHTIAAIQPDTITEVGILRENREKRILN